MSKREPDITSRVVPLILAAAQKRGLDVASLVQTFKLPTDIDLTPGKTEITLSMSAMKMFAQHVADLLGDEHFGLTLVTMVPKGSYGVAEFLTRAAPVLRQAFENTVRFNSLLAPHQTFRFEEVDGEARLHNFPTAQPQGLGRHLNEYTTAITVRTLHAISDAPVTHVWFASPAPASRERLQQTFGTDRFEFDQPTNGFAISAAALDQPLPSGDPALAAFLEENARAALEQRPKHDDLVDRLRSLLRDALKQGEPNIERLSMRLNMSARTLQRRLSDLQTSFQDVLDQVRFDLARAFLKNDRLDVSEVAYLLGYSELRAFDRAFKRWAGKTPGEWRNPQSLQ